MTRTIVMRRTAVREAEDAADRYEQQKPGLGVQFSEAVEGLKAALADAAEMYAEEYNGLRAAPVGQFPYSLYYRISGTDVVVVGVVHHSRDPSTWQSRA